MRRKLAAGNRRFIASITLLLFTTVAVASDGVPEPLTHFRDCDVCPEMIAIPTGEFVIGQRPTADGTTRLVVGPVVNIVEGLFCGNPGLKQRYD